MLVTVGCAFVRNVTDNEVGEQLHPVISPVHEEHHVDQYRALTMLYQEAGRDHTESVDDDDISDFLGEVDELIRGGDTGFSGQRQSSPNLEAIRRRLSSTDETDEALAAVREEERVMQELNVGLQQLHSLSNFDKNQLASGNKDIVRVEVEALRNFFACVIKVNPKARGMLSGAHTEVMNVGILGEVVGASFSMQQGCVSLLSWAYSAPTVEDDDSESEEENGEDEDVGSDSSEDDEEVISQLSTVDVSKALCPLSQLKSLVIGARCLTGGVEPLLGLGLEELQLEYSQVAGALDALSEANIAQLQSLKLRGTSVTSGSLSALGSCPNLRVLDLRQTVCGGHLSELSHCPLLEELFIDGTAVRGDISWVCQCRCLRRFSASNSRLTVGKSMPGKAGGGGLGGDSAAGHTQSALEYVDVSHTYLGGSLALVLDAVCSSARGSQLAVLEHLDLTACGLSGSVKCLRRCPQLKEVGLRYNSHIGGDLSEWLPQDKLEYADVRGTSVPGLEPTPDTTVLVSEFPCQHAVEDDEEYVVVEEEVVEEEEEEEEEVETKLPPPLPPHPRNISQRVRTI